MIRHCVFPGCQKNGYEFHHIVYAWDDTERHFGCRRRKGQIINEVHKAEIVSLCAEHHRLGKQSITRFNERMSFVLNRYEGGLSCHQRRMLWKLWLEGKYPPGIQP